ncbi:MAG: hypothetical protein ACPL8I_12720, partial [Chloroflexaceae bacterium]
SKRSTLKLLTPIYRTFPSWQGQIAAAQGEPFAGHFLAALETLQAIDSAFERACVEARYGEALATAGDSAAAEYRKRAGETFRKIGANGELRRLAAQ